MKRLDDGWKDVIAHRLQDREEKKHLFEIMLNTIERDVAELLNELVADYHIKASLKVTGENEERKWIIKIEDHSFEVTSDVFARYFKTHNDVKKSFIAIILDNFHFTVEL